MLHLLSAVVLGLPDALQLHSLLLYLGLQDSELCPVSLVIDLWVAQTVQDLKVVSAIPINLIAFKMALLVSVWQKFKMALCT